MNFQRLLETSSAIVLSEESFAAQRTLEVTMDQMRDLAGLAEIGPLPQLVAVREGGQYRCVALMDIFEGETLVMTSAVCDPEKKDAFDIISKKLFRAAPPARVIDLNEEERLPERAVIHYYASRIPDKETRGSSYFQKYGDVYSPKRADKAARTIRRVNDAGISLKGSVLEICCGNGMSTLGLREAGLDPISVDVNEDEVSVGLYHGVLKKDRTIVLDAAALSAFFDKNRFDVCVGFMLGTIHDYNRAMWLAIVREAAFVTAPGGRLLLTVRTLEEAQIISGAMEKEGIAGEILDNRDAETEYDQWIWTGTVPAAD